MLLSSIKSCANSQPQPAQSAFTPEKAHKVKVCISFALSTLNEKKRKKNLNDKKEEKWRSWCKLQSEKFEWKLLRCSNFQLHSLWFCRVCDVKLWWPHLLIHRSQIAKTKLLKPIFYSLAVNFHLIYILINILAKAGTNSTWSSQIST